MERPQATLYMYMVALQATSSRKSLAPKDDIVSGIDLNTMVKILTNVRCMRIKSMGFLR